MEGAPAQGTCTVHLHIGQTVAARSQIDQGVRLFRAQPSVGARHSPFGWTLKPFCRTLLLCSESERALSMAPIAYQPLCRVLRSSAKR
jgi:hypothetical protein